MVSYRAPRSMKQRPSMSQSCDARFRDGISDAVRVTLTYAAPNPNPDTCSSTG